MFKSAIAKSITALIVGALVASLAAVLTPAVPEAKAESPLTGTLRQPQAKGDLLPALAKGAACSPRSWPYYDQSCQFDLRRPANDARTVRVIALR